MKQDWLDQCLALSHQPAEFKFIGNRRYRVRPLSMTRSAVSGRKFKERHPEYNAQRQKEWREKHPEKSLANRENEKKKRQRDPRNQMLKSAWSRSKRLKTPFNLVLGDIIIPRLCPVLGIKIKRTGTRRTNHSPSLDRIIPEKGYIRGNIIVISWRANDLKKDATPSELRALANFYGKFS